MIPVRTLASVLVHVALFKLFIGYVTNRERKSEGEKRRARRKDHRFLKRFAVVTSDRRISVISILGRSSFESVSWISAFFISLFIKYSKELLLRIEELSR